MHSVFPLPDSPMYPSMHGPHVCSGVSREQSSRPMLEQSGESVQSAEIIARRCIYLSAMDIVIRFKHRH